MHSLINSGNLVKAKKLSNNFRYLDDLLGLNDRGLFGEACVSIYPPELTLYSRTDNGSVQADYLDMDIKIDSDGFFAVKLFDKRDAFKFKVINYPCMTYSNVPSLPSYGIYLSQLIRICRICTSHFGFVPAMQKLTQEFLNKGFDKNILLKYFTKCIDSYELEWSKFGVLPEIPATLI